MRLVSVSAVLVAALIWAGAASAHARLSPDVSVSGQLQLYSLAVPTEKEGVTTAKVVLIVPSGFSIDSFVPSPGWQRQLQQSGSGDNAVVQKVTWSGGNVPTEDDALFQFLAEPAKSGTYTFQVQQTYSDGSIVNWSGSESSEDPAPTIEVKKSFGGSGTPLLSVIALVLGAAGVVLGALALLARSGRQLA